MTVQVRLATAALSLVALALPASAAAASLAEVPATPVSPGVSVGAEPADGGAGVDVGVGDTTLHLGAGTGGLSVGTRPRISSPATGGGEGKAPVSTPGDRPGREPLSGDGPRAVLFGPAAGTAAAATRGGGREATGGEREGRRTAAPRKSIAPAAGDEGTGSAQAPFLEFVDRIPWPLKLGLVVLGLIALATWAAWVRARRRLERNAFVDPVTGIANGPAFAGLLERELDRARRYKRPLALLMLDVGIARGRLPGLQEQDLRDVTAAIRERLRKGDIVARLETRRFAVICPEATAASAQTLRRALELRFEDMRLHVATGVVERQPTDLGARDLIARAEADISPSATGASRPRGRAVLRAA
jgi:diguanylate cyclase (GGDEF)-like protein